MQRTKFNYIDGFRQLKAHMLEWLDKRLWAVTLVIAVLIFPSYQFFDLENRFYDFQVKIRYLHAGTSASKYDEDIALIVLDDHAVRTDPDRLLSSRFATTSRTYLAKLVNKIVANKPKAIAIDFLLDEPAVDPSDDQELAQALKNAQNEQVPVILATRLVEQNGLSTPVLPLQVYLQVFDSDKTQLVGHTNLETYRTDGVVRELIPAKTLAPKKRGAVFRYRVPDEDKYYYYQHNNKYYSLSFPFQILRAIANSANEDEVGKVNSLIDIGLLHIDFTYADKKCMWLSSSAVLTGLDDPTLIAEKIVVIGASFSWATDKKRTPLSTETFFVPGIMVLDKLQPDMIGARLHIYALRTLARAACKERLIKVANDWLLVLMVFIISCCIGLFYLMHSSNLYLAIIVLIEILGYYILHSVLFQNYLIYLPVARPMGMVLVSITLLRLFKRTMATGVNAKDVCGGNHE
jgi:CHASE2 domain-containing sensor protein